MRFSLPEFPLESDKNSTFIFYLGSQIKNWYHRFKSGFRTYIELQRYE
jgi:hypothetical protein